MGLNLYLLTDNRQPQGAFVANKLKYILVTGKRYLNSKSVTHNSFPAGYQYQIWSLTQPSALLRRSGFDFHKLDGEMKGLFINLRLDLSSLNQLKLPVSYQAIFSKTWISLHRYGRFAAGKKYPLFLCPEICSYLKVSVKSSQGSIAFSYNRCWTWFLHHQLCGRSILPGWDTWTNASKTQFPSVTQTRNKYLVWNVITF